MNQKTFFLVSIRTLFHLATHRQCFVLKVNNFLQEKSSFNVFQQMLKMSHYKSKVFSGAIIITRNITLHRAPTRIPIQK